MATASIAQSYVGALQKLGFTTEINKSGDIHASRDGLMFLAAVWADDPTYFFLVMSLGPVKPKDVPHALEVANDCTAMSKVAKVFINKERDYASATVEMFLPEANAFEDILERSIRALSGAGSAFKRGMQKESAANVA